VPTPQPFGFYNLAVEGSEGVVAYQQQFHQPQYQPVYYSYQAPQTPIYFQPQAPNHDNTLNSTDSGVAEANIYPQQVFQQSQYPVVFPSPIYYPPQVVHSPHIPNAQAGQPPSFQIPQVSSASQAVQSTNEQVIPQNSQISDTFEEPSVQSAQKNE
jgi:hypothetical protein